MQHQIVFLVPEGLVNWGSIIAVSEILQWADDHWQGRGRKKRLKMFLAVLNQEATAPKMHFPVLSQMNMYEITSPDMIIIPSLSQQYKSILGSGRAYVDWINRQHLNGAEIASICTGAFLLAATGLVDKMPCATHWDAADELRDMFPKVQVCLEVLTANKGIYTNGGGYSFLNLALFLVEKYFDRPTAIHCGKMFQIDIGRSTQSPFAIFAGQKTHGDPVVIKAQEYIEEHISERISPEALATELAASRRNFDRRFIKATGNTLMGYIQRARMEIAKKALEETDCHVSDIMLTCGYNDEKAFREAFRKVVGLLPLDYKARYRRFS
ncbi:transcriptional regulator, AraC family with amidase-like domain [Dyadobacter soli]|uniref:Transcriptional regulator, AraC family with amidase-like domain n=1 Tax=Dyadobacter soli TaxID=659014 RepID=A0A1G7MD73_9BACT|nr:helix-turn-helix domain-containing protein [Dyadobacter soli]SDF59616.1 transcriptional regulator, AraC family with amidase-like domain [Dyadobacter soli]